MTDWAFGNSRSGTKAQVALAQYNTKRTKSLRFLTVTRQS